MKKREYGFKPCYREMCPRITGKHSPLLLYTSPARLFTNRKRHPSVRWKGQSCVFKQNWLRCGFWPQHLLVGWGLSEIINVKLYQYPAQYLALSTCSIKTMPTWVRNELKIEIFWLYILCFYFYNAVLSWEKIMSKIIQGEMSFTVSFFFSKYLTLNKEKKIYVLLLPLWWVKRHSEFI